MSKFLIIVFVLVCALNSFAQTPTKLPGGIAQWTKEDSLKLLQDSSIKSRLKKLLGKKNYADFMESWETVNPIVKKGDFVFSSGCLIHACGHIESAIAIDSRTQIVHAAIFREGEKIRYFNEQKRKTPQVIKNWAYRLLKNAAN